MSPHAILAQDNRPNAGRARHPPSARHSLVVGLCLTAVLAALPLPVSAQDIPTTLTDVIQQGSGNIDLLKDVSTDGLAEYLNSNDLLMLGIDLNESADGVESSGSMGVAIRSLSLVISTTTGTFSFSDFYTSTTAQLLASGSTTASQYYTVFGDAGSNEITGGGDASFELGRFDDVIYLKIGDVTGSILTANLQVSFLKVDGRSSQSTTTESFFDFSGGFEDLAILNAQQANALEVAQVGTATAPTTVSYTSTTLEPIQTTSTSTNQLAPPPPSSGAPALPAWMGLGLLGLMAAKRRRA